MKEAILLHRQRQFDQAARLYEKILQRIPQQFDALHLLGVLRGQQGRFEDGLKLITDALRVRPQAPEALSNLGNVLQGLARYNEAADAYRRALALKPTHVDALQNLGNTLMHLKRVPEAAETYDRALSIAPQNIELVYNRANALRQLQRYDEALAGLERTVALNPNHPHAFGVIALLTRVICDWRHADPIAARLRTGVQQQNLIVSPLNYLLYFDDPGEQLQCARRYVRDKMPSALPPLHRPGRRDGSGRIRIVYVSADFRDHPVGHAIVGLLERHDRNRFDIVGICIGTPDTSPVRQRIIGACNEFHHVRERGDDDIARFIAQLQPDILVDLMGHTQDSRPRILAYRPAAIQAGYLGYPGTTGMDFIDYVIADATVVPAGHDSFYTEKIVRLPESYLAHDSAPSAAAPELTRSACGLPEQGIVFCALTQSVKITPEMFALWMRLLKRVDGSVLWLARMNQWALDNVRREATAHGIDPERLIVAPRVERAEHLARQALADMFLDTIPYNAHSTAADALTAGLPLVTCRGNSFASRVGASLLVAAGVPELIAGNLEEYETLALKLATDPALRQSYRDRLDPMRRVQPLFDVDVFRRHIESAYVQMYERRQRGEPPAGFSIDRVA